MVLHGLLDTARDVDLVASAEGWKHALTLGSAQQADVDLIIEPASGVEVFSGWLGDSVPGLFGRAHSIHGLLVAAPDDILAFKKRLDRPKDQEHIRLLERFTCNNH